MTPLERKERAQLAGAVIGQVVWAALWACFKFALLLAVLYYGLIGALLCGAEILHR